MLNLSPNKINYTTPLGTQNINQSLFLKNMVFLINKILKRKQDRSKKRVWMWLEKTGTYRKAILRSTKEIVYITPTENNFRRVRSNKQKLIPP